MALAVQEADWAMSHLNFYPKNKLTAFDHPRGSNRTVAFEFYDRLLETRKLNTRRVVQYCDIMRVIILCDRNHNVSLNPNP